MSSFIYRSSERRKFFNLISGAGLVQAKPRVKKVNPVQDTVQQISRPVNTPVKQGWLFKVFANIKRFFSRGKH